MTHRRLWTEEGRERSLDNLVDLLEGYYRCRPSSGVRESGCKPSTPSLGYSALGYLEFLNRLGQAYATLPLRVLSQMYLRDGEKRVADDKSCAEERRGALQVAPQCLSLFIESDLAVGRFTVRCKPQTDIHLSFTGFKDTGGNAVSYTAVAVHDDRGEWAVVSNGHKLHFENEDSRTIAIKVGVPSSTNPGLLVGNLHLLSNVGSACLKIELRSRKS